MSPPLDDDHWQSTTKEMPWEEALFDDAREKEGECASSAARGTAAAARPERRSATRPRKSPVEGIEIGSDRGTACAPGRGSQ